MSRNTPGSEEASVDASGATDSAGATEATPKAKKEPTRGTLPDGYVTPVGLATALTAQGLHTDKHGVVTTLKPQVVYSYIKNAPKDYAFPMESVTDSLGKTRAAVRLDAGIAWWVAKNARTASNKEASAAKAAAKAAKAAAAPTADAPAPEVG